MKTRKLKAVYLSVFLLLAPASAFAQTSAHVDQYGQNLSYNASYASAGCSELAWNQMVAAYQSKVNEEAQKSEKMNDAILKATVNPNKIQWEGCVGNAAQMFNGLMGDVKSFMSNIQNFSVGNIVNGLLGSLADQLTNAACTAMSNQINNALKDSGLEAAVGQVSQISQNPFGYALNEATNGQIQSLDVNAELNKVLSKQTQNLISK